MAVCLVSLAERGWFKWLLFFLVSAVFVNNMWLLYLIARRTTEFLG
jgi:hypothetical protein